MALIMLARLLRFATGKLSDDELIAVADSEEQALVDASSEGARA
jgi:hypothetical protein